jgi:hypothetical protein
VGAHRREGPWSHCCQRQPRMSLRDSGGSGGDGSSCHQGPRGTHRGSPGDAIRYRFRDAVVAGSKLPNFAQPEHPFNISSSVPDSSIPVRCDAAAA